MSEYRESTIRNLVEKIDDQEIILPAMQRSFVWPEDKIYHLFDSLMRGYPIGTFLFWDIKQDVFKQYAFNQFINDVDESKGKLQRGDKVTASRSNYVAVLDGQQRMTALYVGTTGKWKTHKKNTAWKDLSSYYDRYLCLDVLFYPDEDESYSFRFVPAEEVETISEEKDKKGNVIATHYWLRVSKVFETVKLPDGTIEEFDPADYMDDFSIKYPDLFPKEERDKERKKRRKMLDTLKNSLTVKTPVYYYEASGLELSQVIDIFVRTNSGGQKLSASDLMLSIASGTLGTEDIHVKVQVAIDDINSSAKDQETSFQVDKDLLLTAGLMFTGSESVSLNKKENYSRSKMDAIFITNWDKIRDALSTAVQYIEYLGFYGKKLTSKNLLLPIAYYFYKNDIGIKHKDSTSKVATCDRVFIRQWMLRAIVKDVFLEGTGSTLIAIRNVIDKTKEKCFPLKDLIAAKIKNDLTVGTDEIDEILNYKYGDAKLIPILLEITKKTPAVYHVDHMWPKDTMSNKTKIKKEYPTISISEMDYYKNSYNNLSNLQLLFPVENQQKSETLYGDWITLHHSDPKDSYFEINCVPTSISYDFSNFKVFTEEREKLMRARLKDAFPDDYDEIVKRYALEKKLP